MAIVSAEPAEAAETSARVSIHRCNKLIFISIYYNCNWFDTRWQQYSTHLHTNSTQNGTYITMKRKKNWEVRAVPRLRELYSNICLTTEEKHGQTSE
jgi:hypothetical protein